MGKFKIPEGLELQNLSTSVNTDVLGYNSTTGEVTYQPSVPNPLNVGGPITGSDLKLTSVDEHPDAYYLSGDTKILALDGTDVKYLDFNKVVQPGFGDSDDVIYIDSNYGTSPNYERVINDASGTSLPDLKNINGRTIWLDQSNTYTGTLRFGLANWNTTNTNNPYNYGVDFQCELINRGTNKVRLSFYVPDRNASWKFYWIGNDSGGGSVYNVLDIDNSYNAVTKYSPKYLGSGSRTKIHYNWFQGAVIVHCTNWTN